jgi:hypothetical protein
MCDATADEDQIYEADCLTLNISTAKAVIEIDPL